MTTASNWPFPCRSRQAPSRRSACSKVTLESPAQISRAIRNRTGSRSMPTTRAEGKASRIRAVTAPHPQARSSTRGRSEGEGGREDIGHCLERMFAIWSVQVLLRIPCRKELPPLVHSASGSNPSKTSAFKGQPEPGPVRQPEDALDRAAPAPRTARRSARAPARTRPSIRAAGPRTGPSSTPACSRPTRIPADGLWGITGLAKTSASWKIRTTSLIPPASTMSGWRMSGSARSIRSRKSQRCLSCSPVETGMSSARQTSRSPAMSCSGSGSSKWARPSRSNSRPWRIAVPTE